MKRLQQYLQIKNDPAMATLLQLEQLKNTAEQIIQQSIDKETDKIKLKFEKDLRDAELEIKKQLNPLTKTLIEEIREYVYSNPQLFKGEKGDSIKGQDGKTPTLEEIIEKVKSHIPPAQKGEDGKTPVPELDYPSERQIKEMVSKMGEDMKKEHEQKMKEMMPKMKLPTFDEIARGIESLPEKQKLDYYKGLKNIPSISSTYQEPIRVGGGMGNWEHEVFNTSSATTSVTLARKVAASGSAILVRYQGQLLAHGVQYTISGKTINFTFALEDSTFIEITYVRA